MQDNHSRSVAGTLRGLHLQLRQPQGKLIRVIEGEIFDVAVDVRRGSPTFGRWVGVTLSAENFRQCYVPPGFAHGFCVVSPIAQVEYKCTDIYDPAERARHRLERPGASRFTWPIAEPVLSARDARNPPLAAVIGPAAGLTQHGSVISRHKVVCGRRAVIAGTRRFPNSSFRHAACHRQGRVVGLITAGRRECWGSQTSGAGGHRNHAMPFCFVHWRACGSISTPTSANRSARTRSAPVQLRTTRGCCNR